MVQNNKKGAMEMSVGTIVTIVLLMTVLILGIFLVQKVFRSGSGAIDSIDNEVQNQISKLFADEGKRLAVYPTSQEISLKKGDDPKGFAFSVKNKEPPGGNSEFTYEVKVNSQDASFSKCGITEGQANGFLLGGSGSFSLSPGNSMENPRLVKFNIPETAPSCTLIYELDVNNGYAGAQIFVTLK